MTKTFNIKNVVLQIDTLKTKEFYLTQNKITDDCKCEDCNFYASNFIKNEFEVFSIFKNMGIDLSKNLTTEPTGVWCIRDDNGQVLHCLQVYQAVGQFTNTSVSKLAFEKIENDFKIYTTAENIENGKIYFELMIDNV